MECLTFSTGSVYATVCVYVYFGTASVIVSRGEAIAAVPGMLLSINEITELLDERYS